MLERLDNKYGDPCKIMESIISDVHRFRKLEMDDTTKIIQFVNILEKAHRDLKALDLEKEITNANTISIISFLKRFKWNGTGKFKKKIRLLIKGKSFPRS